MPNFETFNRKAARRVPQPLVTIQKKGSISMNHAAVDALGGAEALELLYDSAEQIVGFRKGDPDSPNCYPIRAQQNASSYIIAGQAFTQHYGIDTTVARRYEAKMYGDVLGVDLTSPSVEVSHERRRKRSGEQAEGDGLTEEVSGPSVPSN